jgi:hypothetical protein
MVSWLAEQGVRSIPIISRTGKLSPVLAQLLQGNASAVQQALVHVVTCDAACAADVEVLQQLLSGPVPLLGVMHAGGLLADATFNKQNLAGVRQASIIEAVMLTLYRCLVEPRSSSHRELARRS